MRQKKLLKKYSMQKKKELPRKRRRFIRKVFFFTTLSCVILVVVCCFLIYLFVIKLKKPLFISPLPAMQMAQASQGEKVEYLLEDGLRKEKISYKTIKSDNDSYIVTLQDGGEVTFSTQK